MVQALKDHQFDHEYPIILNSPSRAELSWSITSFHSVNGSSRLSNPFRCVKGRLVCLLPRQNHQRKVVKSGVDSTHQHTRTESSISSSASLCKGPVSQVCFSEDGQNYCGGICDQYGRYPLGPSDDSCSRDVDLVSSAGYHNFNPECSCKGKYYSRCRILCNSSNWCLDTKILAPFLKNCNTDLFASWLTAQLPQYISWRPDPGAFHIDGLTFHWKLFRGYVFPHFNLIPVVLNKVVRARADQVLVAPV